MVSDRNDRGGRGGTGGFGGGGFGGGFGGGGSFGGGGVGGGGHSIPSSSAAGYTKEQEAGLSYPSNPPAFGSEMPSSNLGGHGDIPVASSSGWNYMPNGTAGPTSFGSSQPHDTVAGSGMPYGASGPGMGGNVNYVSTPGGSSGTSANAGMQVAGGGIDGMSGGGHGVIENGGIDTANVNIGNTAGTTATGEGFGIPESHNPLAGGVPVLPDVSLQLR